MLEKRPLIYVVESDERVAILLSIKLDANGFVVKVFDHGHKALDALKTTKPDLIISEILLPEFTGYELLQAIREIYNDKNLPFFFLSTLSLEEDIVKGLEAGANDFIAKPFSFPELKARIKKWIE